MGRQNQTKRFNKNIKQKILHKFQQYETKRSFGESTYTCKASIVEVERIKAIY